MTDKKIKEAIDNLVYEVKKINPKNPDYDTDEYEIRRWDIISDIRGIGRRIAEMLYGRNDL